MFRNAFRVQNFAQNYVQDSQKKSAKLNFSKFCQTLANVQKRLPRSKFRAKLCAKLPENFAKLDFPKFCQTLANVQKRIFTSKITRKTHSNVSYIVPKLL